jgi:hypothetical protein
VEHVGGSEETAADYFGFDPFERSAEVAEKPSFADHSVGTEQAAVDQIGIGPGTCLEFRIEAGAG